MEPLVSIIIPTHNRPEILFSCAIKSVLNQTYKNWELIIIDDGSTDNTSILCQNLARDNEKIKYFFQENKGQGAARNNGIKKSIGDFVILLDSDDYLLSNMVSLMVKIISEKKYDVVYSRRWVFSYNKDIFDVNSPNPSCTIQKKELFNKFGYFDENPNIRGIEDTDLLIFWQIQENKLKENIKYLYINPPLVVYLEHDNQETNHSDIKKLKIKTQSVIDKYLNNKLISNKEIASHVSLKYKELGNFNILLGDRKIGQINLIESIKKQTNLQAMLLLIISLFGKKIYANFVYVFKNFREKIIWKIRLNKAIKKYPELYKEAQLITSTYKNW